MSEFEDEVLADLGRYRETEEAVAVEVLRRRYSNVNVNIIKELLTKAGLLTQEFRVERIP